MIIKFKKFIKNLENKKKKCFLLNRKLSFFSIFVKFSALFSRVLNSFLISENELDGKLQIQTANFLFR